jgi:hypothetical protein
MAFQTSVGVTMAPGIEGGWTGFNPHFTLTNPDDGQWVVGAGGAIIGRFGWGNPATGTITSANPGIANAVAGFIHRDQEAFITGLLNASTLALVVGQPVDALEDGPVWCRFAAGGTYGMYVYVSYADGSARAASTNTAAATTTYSVTTTSGSPNLTAVGAGAAAGQPITGAGIPANTYLVSVTGTTAVMSANATASATVTATATTDFASNWRLKSTCLSGEIAKIAVRG